MGNIHIIGDTHGDQFRFIYSKEEKAWDSSDLVIVLGDFGFLFANDATEAAFLNDLQRRPYSIAFVDGNHENFPVIYNYPVEIWNGGHVHRIRKNIVHLIRGNIFQINGRSFFVMGGAFSTDRSKRKRGISFWEEEMPTKEEMETAWENLIKHNLSVDFILTHTAPLSIIKALQCTPTKEEEDLNIFLEKIFQSCDFGHWFFGHWHKDKQLAENVTAVYQSVIHI